MESDVKYYFNSVKQLTACFSFSVILLFSFAANASECGVLQLQTSRSSGVSVDSSTCNDPSSISIGTVFNVAAKGRLWLKSIPSEVDAPQFQMICQNRGESTVYLEFSDNLSPWINQSKLNNCTGWVNNILSCGGTAGEKKAVTCVLTYAKSKQSIQSKTVERTTSVKMRSLKSLLQETIVALDKEEILNVIRPELESCKQVNQTQQQIKVSWLVKNAVVQELDINVGNKQKDAILNNCLETVVKTTEYPQSTEAIPFVTIF